MLCVVESKVGGRSVEQLSELSGFVAKLVALMVAFIGGITLDEWQLIVGIAMWGVALAINLYYRRRQDRRDEIRMRRELSSDDDSGGV